MKYFGIIVALILSAEIALAAGFEKSIMWSGRYAGVGNAAVGSARGGEALYFNPAGLATGNPGVGDVSLNISPTMAEFKGSYFDNVTSTSDTSATFPFAFVASYNLNKRLGFGVGAYAAAGSEVQFNDVQIIPGYAHRPDTKTSLQAIELAAGADYMVNQDIRIGAAWRIALAQGEFWAAAPRSPTEIVAFKLEDLKGEEFAGFKLGATYSPSSNWAIGATWRSEFKFELEGVSSGEYSNAPGTVATLPGTDTTVSVIFPAQYALGGYYHIIPNVLSVAAEYAFTEYSKNKSIGTTGTLASIGDIPDVTLNWKDQQNVRLGVEYLGLGFPIRAGYVFTSAVAVKDNATPTLTPPAAGHTFTIGTGHGIWNQKLMLNIAGEFTTTAGDVPVTDGYPAGGEYGATAYAAHLGATYSF